MGLRTVHEAVSYTHLDVYKRQVSAFNKAHAQPAADIWRKGCVIVEIPIYIEEEGLQVPAALQGRVQAVFGVPIRF